MTARLLEGKYFAAKIRDEAGKRAAQLKEKLLWGKIPLLRFM